MRLSFFFLPVSLLLLYSCNNNTVKTSMLKPDNLQSSFISIAADSAYVLKTAKGGIIRIEKNSFNAPANAKIQLEIKEAYSMQDILLAGLATETNGKPLISGGMIYINAFLDGKELSLSKPIKISIPTAAYDEKMQLYSGEEKPDSSLNWIDPKPLDSSSFLKNIVLGRQLFQYNCANCHKVFSDYTGSALAGYSKRIPNRDWLYQFISSPTGKLNTGDAYTKHIVAKWKPTIMTAFPDLGKTGIDAIYDFIDNEEALKKADPDYKAPINSKPAVADSTGDILQNKTTAIVENEKPCGTDTVYYKKDTAIQSLPTNAQTDSVAKITYNFDNTKQWNDTGRETASDLQGLRQGFNDPNPTIGMYDFTINTLGWYNVDFNVEGYPGTIYAKLDVQLQMNGDGEMHVYLFCPKRKMLSVGSKHAGNNYGFDKIDGKIPLFLNDNAVIFAFGSHADKMFYGTSPFKIKKEQTINVAIKETTEAQLNAFIKKNEIDGIKIDVDKKEDFKIMRKPCGTDTTATAKGDTMTQ
jgi:hypothetical protein